MVWVIARTPAEAQEFMESQTEVPEWQYLGHAGYIINHEHNPLNIVLVEGWTERLDAGLLRIHFENCDHLNVLYGCQE